MSASEPQVFINGRFLTQRVTGVQRYARETLHALDELLAARDGAGLRWTVLVPRGAPLPILRYLAVETFGRLRGHLWEQLELPWRTRAGLLFSFCLTGPLLKRRQIITVHDAAVVRMPQAFNITFRNAYRYLVRCIAARAPLTMTVSQFSSAEAIECFRAPADRVRVATEGWQHLQRITPDVGVLDAHGLRKRRYALAVGSPTPNKNLAVIERAITLLGADAPCCVAVGESNAAVFRKVGHTASDLMRIGYVSDAQLMALYQHAECFVFPSFYEGFGIPPLEAMACGCPVIASTTPAVREVCGDAALYFDPARPEQLADALRRLFADAAQRERLRNAGTQRLQHYSWDASAALNLAAIREVMCP